MSIRAFLFTLLIGASLLNLASAGAQAESGAAAPFLAAIAADEEGLGRSPQSRDRFFEPAGRPRACALLLHGLNTEPAAMDCLARELASQGVLVFRAALAGHGGPRESWAAASSERWLSDAALAWRVVAARAKELAVPSLAVGFSLGALVLVDLSHSDNSVRPDAFVLLAPATVLRPRVYLLHPLTALGIAIASAAPRAYRSASVLPAKAYRAFFDLVDRAAGQPLPRFRPSLVFVDSEDFLVDAGALTAAAARERECRLVTIHSRGYVAGARHHLILDIDSMGAEAWHTMTEELRSFVDGVAASGPRAQSP